MTPKEKAIELINKFIPLCERELEKQCALIAVDEIIEIQNYWSGSNGEEYMYWQEVRNEIEQL